MPVKTHQAFYFLALCEEQSFTRAARRCGIAQPSLTRAIQNLESEFGGQLFERNRPIVRLTHLGHFLRPDFERIVRATTALTRKVAEINDHGPPNPALSQSNGGIHARSSGSRHDNRNHHSGPELAPHTARDRGSARAGASPDGSSRAAVNSRCKNSPEP